MSETCSHCKLEITIKDEYRWCSEFCATTSDAIKEALTNLKIGSFGIWPCPYCGVSIEDVFNEDPCCSTCWPRVQLSRVRVENDALKLENIRLEEVARRRWQDRYDALNVKSRDGLLASEWLLRTGKAERACDEARAQAELRSAQLALVHQHVDLTNPSCPIGIALTKAGCALKPQTDCACLHEAGDAPCTIHGT